MAIIDKAHIGSCHCIKVLVIFISHNDYLSEPFFILDELFHIVLNFRSLLDRDDCSVVIKGWRLWRQRSRA